MRGWWVGLGDGMGVLDGRGAGWMDRLCVLVVFDLCGVLSGTCSEIQGDERFYRLRCFFWDNNL